MIRSAILTQSTRVTGGKTELAWHIRAYIMLSRVKIVYRAKRSVARYCHDKLSVRLSVRPSVTLVDCDHTRWNSAKIISRLISLGTSLSADTNITDLLQREHP